MDRSAVGWYPDPSDDKAQIYWDGQRWNGRRELLPRPTMRMADGVDRIDMDQIRDLVIKLVPSAQDVRIDDSDYERDIQFQVLDDQGDPVEIILFRYHVDLRVLVLFTQAPIDNDDYNQVQVLRACNAWNANHYPHQSACFLMINDDEDLADAIWLQSSLWLLDGQIEEIIKGWVNDFLASIDEWQYVVLEALDLLDYEEDGDDPADASDGAPHQATKTVSDSWYRSQSLLYAGGAKAGQELSPPGIQSVNWGRADGGESRLQGRSLRSTDHLEPCQRTHEACVQQSLSRQLRTSSPVAR